MYDTAETGVRGAAHSLHYAAPFIAAVAVVAALYMHGELLSPYAAAALMLVALLLFGTTYTVAILHVMVRGYTPPFMEVLRWRLRDFDFLVFVALSFIFCGSLVAMVANFGVEMHNYAESLRSAQSPDDKYGYKDSMVLVVLFGSRVFATGFFILSVLLWSFFFRTVMRMPAYIDGYDLRASEALALTRHDKFRILAVSLLMNVGLSAAALSSWRDTDLWLRALLAGFAVWSFLHANLALSVAIYRKYTEGYRMNPLRPL